MKKRIKIISGHFGSGKTEFAVNYAQFLRKEIDGNLYLVDLDIVNPYFRSREKTEELKLQNIEVLGSALGGDSSDMPSLSAGIYKIFDDTQSHSIIDLGGDPDGATALGRYKSYLDAKNIDFWFVLNANRPYTQDLNSAKAFVKALEEKVGLKITGIINATHMVKYTTHSDVEKGYKLALELSRDIGVEVIYNVALESIASTVDLPNVFPIQLAMRKEWMS